MRRSTAVFLAALGVTALGAIAPTTASAQINLFANLTNDQESVPAIPTTILGAPRPASFGTAMFQINPAGTAMTFTATIFNVDFTGAQTTDPNDNLTAAHIHARPDAGLTAPVVWGFFGSPQNDINPNDVVFTPFLTGVGGTVSGKWDAPEGNNTTLSAQLANILAGRAYINFHTTQFGGGEVRGQLTVVPEPSTVLLTAAGMGVLALVNARRRSRRNADA